MGRGRGAGKHKRLTSLWDGRGDTGPWKEQDVTNRRVGLREETAQAWINLGISSEKLYITNNLEVFVFLKNKFIYFWLHWVFVAACGLSLVAESGGYSWLRCVGFSLRWLLLLRSTGSRHESISSCGTRASVVVALGLSSCGSRALEHRLSSCGAGLSCSAACGIFPDQGSNPCPLHWQADS